MASRQFLLLDIIKNPLFLNSVLLGKKKIYIYWKQHRVLTLQPTGKVYSWNRFVFTHIFAAHRDRQVGQFRTRTDPQEKPAAQLRDVKVYDLLQNLLRKIVHRNGFTHGRLLRSAHFVKVQLVPLRQATTTWTRPLAVRRNRYFLVREKRQAEAIQRRCLDVDGTSMTSDIYQRDFNLKISKFNLLKPLNVSTIWL